VFAGTFVDSVLLWDWYAMFNTRFLGQTIAATAGRHATSLDQGLLVDTNAQPLLGVSLDSGFKHLTYGANVSLIDRAVSASDPLFAQDAFTYLYLGYDFGLLSTNFAVMPTGFATEKGASLALEGKLFGTRLYTQYAHMVAPGTDLWSSLFDNIGDADSMDAVIAGADLLNNWHGLTLSAKYGKVNAGYDSTLSILHPYADVNAYDTGWIDRPLFLDKCNVTAGYEVAARMNLGSKLQLSGRYYNGTHEVAGEATQADPVFTVALKHEIANGVWGNLTYGQRQVHDRVSGDKIGKLQEARVGLEFAL